MMKTILVLTDFSENALKAAETAIMLCGKLKANLLLFYANYIIPAIPYYPGMVLVNDNILWEEECKNKLNQLADHLKMIISQVNSEQHKPGIRIQMGEGDLWSNVKDIVGKENIEMITMGGRSGSTIDHIVFGSDTNAIIDHAPCPVLIVSSGSLMSKLDRLVFATDFCKGDRDAISYLVELGKLFPYQLEIVHVSLYGDHSIPEDPHLIDFIKSVEERNYPNVIYTGIRGKSLIQRLLRVCKEKEADVLALTHQRHSYLIRILKEGNVKKTVIKQKLPILIFPAGGVKSSSIQKNNQVNILK